MKSSLWFSYLAVVMAGILNGFLVFGGKVMSLNNFSLLEILIIPNLIALVVLFFFIKPEYKKFYSAPFWITALYFISLIMIQIAEFVPLFLGLSVSLTVFLMYTQPLWTSLISIVFLGVPFTRKDGIMIVSMLAGLLFLLSPWEGFHFSTIGFIIALLGGVALSGWVVINGAYYAKKDIKPLTITFISCAYQSFPFLLAAPLIIKYFPNPSISGLPLDHSRMAIFLVVMYAITVYIGAQFLFYIAGKKINSIYLGFILLLEPVTATFLDIVFLNTHLTWNILIGGLLIIGTNGFLILKSNKGS